MNLPPPSGDRDQLPGVEADPTIDTQNKRLDDGVNRCPRCGATEIELRPSAGLLICLFCRHEWSEARLDETVPNGDLAALTGTTIGSGAANIDNGAESVITMKCGGCGAEVVVNTAEQMGARCHWCRHVLTINEQVPNGAVPDAVLPFKITHDDAMARIRTFAGKRRMFAHRHFIRDFKAENVVGVYMPDMLSTATCAPTSKVSARSRPADTRAAAVTTRRPSTTPMCSRCSDTSISRSTI